MEYMLDYERYAKERAKARNLKQTQWWKSQKGNGECYYCKKRVHPSELTMDHKVPLSRGGTSSKKNLVPCCKDCNSQKTYLTPQEWTEYLNKLGR